MGSKAFARHHTSGRSIVAEAEWSLGRPKPVLPRRSALVAGLQQRALKPLGVEQASALVAGPQERALKHLVAVQASARLVPTV